MIKHFLGKIWLAWSALVFVLSWPIMWVVFKINYALYDVQKNIKPSFVTAKLWGAWMLFWLGVRVKAYGLKNIDPNKQFVYVSNHCSQIDIPINFVTTPEPFVILSKKEATKIPVIGMYINKSHVTVKRRDPKDTKISIEKLSKHLSLGRSILLYPEGRRNRSKEKLGSFKAGAFLLAVQHQLPIVPVTIIGSEKINRPNRPYELYPGKTKIVYGKPIETKGLTNEDIDMLMQQTKQAMLYQFH